MAVWQVSSSYYLQELCGRVKSFNQPFQMHRNPVSSCCVWYSILKELVVFNRIWSFDL